MIGACTLLTFVGLSDFLHGRGLGVPPAPATSALPAGAWRRAVLASATAGLLAALAFAAPWWQWVGAAAGCGIWLLTYRGAGRVAAMAGSGAVVVLLLTPALLSLAEGPAGHWRYYQWALALLAVLAVNLTTANRVVRLALRLADSAPPASVSGPRAGRVIGVLERLLLVGLVLAGQGFGIAGLAAAKSIIRYPEISKAAREGGGLSAEVFFVGTVTSWLIALASTGLIYLGLP